VNEPLPGMLSTKLRRIDMNTNDASILAAIMISIAPLAGHAASPECFLQGVQSTGRTYLPIASTVFMQRLLHTRR